jgi:hypothetical protein
MQKVSTKETAEAALRELPSVLGACVREDIYGHPREVHLLVGPGPNVRNLARDVRGLLEEKLGLPVDQRVISIAQLSGKSAEAALADFGQITAAVDSQQAETPHVGESDVGYRILFGGTETQVQGPRVIVRVLVKWGTLEFIGEAIEIDHGHGRVRAGATAALRAATSACKSTIRLELEAASIVRALDREYVLVAALAGAAMLGRRPLLLSGAQPLEEDAATAAALAALKAINRVLELGLRTVREDVLSS